MDDNLRLVLTAFRKPMEKKAIAYDSSNKADPRTMPTGSADAEAAKRLPKPKQAPAASLATVFDKKSAAEAVEALKGEFCNADQKAAAAPRSLDRLQALLKGAKAEGEQPTKPGVVTLEAAADEPLKKAPEKKPEVASENAADYSKKATAVLAFAKQALGGWGTVVGATHGALRTPDEGEGRLTSMGRGAVRGFGEDVGAPLGMTAGAVPAIALRGALRKLPPRVAAALGGILGIGGMLGGGVAGGYAGYRAGRAVTKRPNELAAEKTKSKPAEKKEPAEKKSAFAPTDALGPMTPMPAPAPAAPSLGQGLLGAGLGGTAGGLAGGGLSKLIAPRSPNFQRLMAILGAAGGGMFGYRQATKPKAKPAAKPKPAAKAEGKSEPKKEPEGEKAAAKGKGMPKGLADWMAKKQGKPGSAKKSAAFNTIGGMPVLSQLPLQHDPMPQVTNLKQDAMKLMTTLRGLVKRKKQPAAAQA